MHPVHPFSRIKKRGFFAKSNLPSNWEHWNDQKKKETAQFFSQKGSEKLLKQDLSAALDLFHLASLLDQNPHFLLKQAKTLLEHGIKEKQKKALLHATKYCKRATLLNPTSFESWKSWGKSLSALGDLTEEYHYLQQAQEKYQKALFLSAQTSQEDLFDFYWDYGRYSILMAKHSEEASDLSMAIQSLKKAQTLRKNLPAEFWSDFGQAHLLLGFLINQNGFFQEAADSFRLALQKNPSASLWFSLGQAYTQLYANTFDPSHFSLAHESFSNSETLQSKNPILYLQWSQLLGEAGKLSRDPQKCALSIEKCTKGSEQTNDPSLFIGQWVESLSYLGAYTNQQNLLLEAQEKIIEATDRFPHIPELWYAYGICLCSFGLYYQDIEYTAAAIEKFQIGLSLDRTLPELWHALARSHTQIGKNTDNPALLERACKFFQKALELKPFCPILMLDYAKTLLQLGEWLQNPKLLEKSLFLFEKISDQVPQKNFSKLPEWLFHYGMALNLLGSLYENEQLHFQAFELFQRLLTIDPHFPKLHYQIAMTLFHLSEAQETEKLFEKVFYCFQLAALHDEEDDKIYLDWGLALATFAIQTDETLFSSYYIEAEKKLRKAGTLGNFHAYYQLACLYSLTHRFEEALSLLKKADSFDALPKISDLLQDEWLENLRETPGFSLFLSQLENKQHLTDDSF